MHIVADLYDGETQFENAIKAVLIAGLTYSPVPTIYIAQSNAVEGTPRVEVRVVNFARADIHVGPNSALDHWTCDVELGIATDRTVTPSQNHGQLRGMVRYLFSREGGKFIHTAISASLTYWTVADWIASGSSTDVESDAREDHTTLKYRGDIGIYSPSFPATVP